MAVTRLERRETVTGGDGDDRPDIPINDEFEAGESEFLAAPGLERTANLLLERHDDTFAFAGNAEITYLWKRAGGKVGGKAVLGKCVKLTGLAKHGIGGDFAIWLAADHARALGLTAWQVEAALFHELSHISWDEDAEKPGVAGHDFAGFVAELNHYGAWYADLEEMGRAARQMPLPGLDDR